MRDFILVFVSALIASVLTYLIADQAASAQAHSAAVVEDAEAGAVRIVIDGKEVAHFTAHGFAVRESIEFGNVITDVGPENFGNHVIGGY